MCRVERGSVASERAREWKGGARDEVQYTSCSLPTRDLYALQSLRCPKKDGEGEEKARLIVRRPLALEAPAAQHATPRSYGACCVAVEYMSKQQL